jgi:hypothetical protein
MPAAQSIVEEVQSLLVASSQGRISHTQFQTERAALLLAAEADLIERRDSFGRELAGGTISGLMAADTRADLQRTEDELRAAATMMGVKRAQPQGGITADEPVLKAVDTAEVDRVPMAVESTRQRQYRRSFIPLDGPEAGILARRIGSVLPTAGGALVFAPVGVLVVMGRLEGWLPILGVVMILLSLACVLSARERWENPDPT